MLKTNALLALLLLSAPAAAIADDRPEWTRFSQAKWVDQQGLVLLGVGMAVDIRNASLLRSTADNRARAEIARRISVPATDHPASHPAVESNPGSKIWSSLRFN